MADPRVDDDDCDFSRRHHLDLRHRRARAQHQFGERELARLPSVRAVRRAGHRLDFLADVPHAVQAVVETRVDAEP